MKTYFTSDLHLGHDRIREYCGRPFENLEEMNSKLISNWNERVKPEDTVYHVGDFCFYKGREAVEGLTKAQAWEKYLNGKIIHIMGNHDKNNGVKSIMYSAMLSFGGQRVLARHIPLEDGAVIDKDISMLIVGHVHEKWKHRLLNNKIPMINVGTDVWNFRPVSMQEILVYYDKLKSQM